MHFKMLNNALNIQKTVAKTCENCLLFNANQTTKVKVENFHSQLKYITKQLLTSISVDKRIFVPLGPR